MLHRGSIRAADVSLYRGSIYAPVYYLEHYGLSLPSDNQYERVADLSVELCDGNGRQTEVHTLIEILVQFFLEASDTVGLSYSGGGCKYADAPRTGGAKPREE